MRCCNKKMEKKFCLLSIRSCLSSNVISKLSDGYLGLRPTPENTYNYVYECIEKSKKRLKTLRELAEAEVGIEA
jgi:hypothetical protein